MKDLRLKALKHHHNKSENQMERMNSERNMNGVSVEMIGPYRVGSLLGKGAYATVKKVKSWKGESYAIKIFEKILFVKKIK